MKLFKNSLIVFLLLHGFVLAGCKPSIPGTYVQQKDGKQLSAELKPDGSYRMFDETGGEVSGKYEIKDNKITFYMFGTQHTGEIKRGRIIMDNGEVWKKK